MIYLYEKKQYFIDQLTIRRINIYRYKMQAYQSSRGRDSFGSMDLSIWAGSAKRELASTEFYLITAVLLLCWWRMFFDHLHWPLSYIISQGWLHYTEDISDGVLVGPYGPPNYRLPWNWLIISPESSFFYLKIFNLKILNLKINSMAKAISLAYMQTINYP